MSHISLRSVVPIGLFWLAVANASGTTIQDFDNANGSIAPGSTVLAYAGVVGSSTCADATSLFQKGTYAVGNNARDCHSLWSSTGPQNPGSTSNFMIVNGDPTNKDVVYQQVVTVVSGQATSFSVWLTGLYSSNPAGITLKVFDGIDVGLAGNLLATSPEFAVNLSSPPSPAAWEKLSTSAFQTLSNTITIQVVNSSRVESGNDFGLDTLDITQTAAAHDSVPEPATFLLAGLSLAVVAFLRPR